MFGADEWWYRSTPAVEAGRPGTCQTRASVVLFQPAHGSVARLQENYLHKGHLFSLSLSFIIRTEKGSSELAEKGRKVELWLGM